MKDRKAAQARANAAADRWAKAQSALARVESEVAKLEQQAAATKAKLSGLEAMAKAVAVNQYVQGGTALPWLLDGDLNEAPRREALVRQVTLSNTDAIDAYRAAQEDEQVTSAALEARLADRKAAATALKRQAAAAQKELQRLAAAEKAYLARLDAQRRASRSRAAGRGAVGVIATGDWVCPVQGPHAFSNDWGQPRSGGRRHQGNDILAARGTPVVAPVSGSVRQHRSGLGGLAFYESGRDGHVYYGAHLSGYAASGSVAAGTVVGYVGDTGNARGTPHLHFEIHPNGGGAVNPFATLSRYC